MDDADDQRLLGIRIAVVDLADESVARAEARDDRAPAVHRVRAALEASAKRRA